jgi:hypothetical protein
MEQQISLETVHTVPQPLSEEFIKAKGRIVFHSEVAVADRRPRQLTPLAADAMQLLAHGMEYLTDSRELSNGRLFELDPSHADVYTLQLMMEAKYQVYLSCPVIERRKNALSGLFHGKERRRPR